MNEEKMMILKMLQEGKISTDEAAKLLKSIDAGGKKGEKAAEADESRKGLGKFSPVMIIHSDSAKTRANFRIPLRAPGIGVKFGAQFASGSAVSSGNRAWTPSTTDRAASS